MKGRSMAIRRSCLCAMVWATMASCTTEDGGGATKGFMVIYADQPPTGAQVLVGGQLRGTLTASYSNGSPGCFGPDGVSAPVGTVTLPIFLGETYAVDVQYTNGTSDHVDITATQQIIDGFCYQIGTHPNPAAAALDDQAAAGEAAAHACQPNQTECEGRCCSGPFTVCCPGGSCTTPDVPCYEPDDGGCTVTPTVPGRRDMDGGHLALSLLLAGLVGLTLCGRRRPRPGAVKDDRPGR